MVDQGLSKPDPAQVAQQLRKPTGPFAKNIAEKMDQVNEPLFDLTLETMQLADNESILEIGFGSGRFFHKMFSKADPLQVSGVDYSREMVDMAKVNNQSLVDSGKLVLESGSSNQLSFADHAFDKVFCNMVIYFWDQPRTHLKEIRRVLKPGGRFYTGMRAKASMLKLPFTQFGFILYDDREWKSILTQNEFAWIDTKKKIDPVIDEEETPIHMESICIVAEKLN